MADGIEFSLTGLDELRKKMAKLKVGARGKPGRRALGKAVNIVAKAARENATRVNDPKTGRAIAQNVGRRFRSAYYKRTGDLMISVGVLTDKGRIPKGNPDTGPKGNTPHWHLVEMGTEKMRAQPFLRPALADNINPAIDAFTTAFEKELDKLAGGQ